MTASTENSVLGEHSTTFCRSATSTRSRSWLWTKAYTASLGMNSSTSSSVSSGSMYTRPDSSRTRARTSRTKAMAY